MDNSIGVTKNVKEGALFKKGSGGGLFKRKNWKIRYFELTYDELKYSDGPVVKGSISLRHCTLDSVEIMPDTDQRSGSGGTIWRIAITTPSRRLLIACASEDDMEDWVDALNLVIDYNTKRKHRSTCKISLSHEATFLDTTFDTASSCTTLRQA
ncbi:Aste57867_20570 [Aphanomyces stellatus]|uniref:Aste57867_20570 protein n=1 Tax=Aphanomyces stellatus TaxID=120398 RepID=A0A485LFZ4_9STRA|nr:hypothetical protein As57867_020503 [Aphanomyces stellatus]VFT97253.1 Aste57867_20570 [Aphanomyces stellatus]